MITILGQNTCFRWLQRNLICAFNRVRQMTMLDNWLVAGVLCNATKLKFNEFRFVDSCTGVAIIHFSNIVNNKQRRIVAARRSPFLGRPISGKVAWCRATRRCIWSCIRFVNKICLLLLLLLLCRAPHF